MKTSNYILFLAIYGGITGIMMLINGKGSLETYGVNPDQYHIAVMQYLGISNLTMALLIFAIRNIVNTKTLKVILLVSAGEMILSSMKGFYDVQIIGIPGNSFFWADAIIRFLVGTISIFIYFKISKETV